MKLNLSNLNTTAKKDVSRNVAMKQSAIKKAATDIEQREKQTYSAKSAGIAVQTRNDNAEVTLDESQRAALWNTISNKHSVISGPAGTGKTTILRNALHYLEHQVTTVDWGAARTAGNFPSNTKKPAIALCCFTNVAAENMASKLDEKWRAHCMSIHSMLAFAPIRSEEEAGEYGIDYHDMQGGMFQPRYHKGHKIPYDIVCIDEAGILSSDLWQQILDASGPETRFIFLGDLFQLPALYGVSPMPFAMQSWPTAYLTKIYRQADGSPIITQAHRIRRGLAPEHCKGKFMCGSQQTLPENTRQARTYIQKYLQMCHKGKIFDPMQDVIIVPQNGTMLGQEEWNTIFRFQFNPPRYEKDLAGDDTGPLLNPPIMIRTGLGSVDFCVGDKVMSTDNGGRAATETRFENGSIGIITAMYPNPDYKGSMEGLGEIDISIRDRSDIGSMAMDMFEQTQNALENENSDDLHNMMEAADESDHDKKRRKASHIVEVQEVSTGRTIILDRSSEIANLQHAYAVTCHKFQGSQCRRAFVILHSSFRANMYSREWLYTAVTRAKEGVVLFHDKPSLMRALTRQIIKGDNAETKSRNLFEKYSAQKSWAVPSVPASSEWPMTAEVVRMLNTDGITADDKIGTSAEA